MSHGNRPVRPPQFSGGHGGNGPRPPRPSEMDHVRRHFHGYNRYWTPDWYRRYPGTWYPYWIPSSRWWYRPAWYDTWSWYGAGFFTGYVVNNVLDPTPYYYGNNIVYRGDMVYVNGVPYVSASEYYRQAAELAASASTSVVVVQEPPVRVENEAEPHTVAKPATVAETENWMPLGTYSVMTTDEDGENVETESVIQLATNKDGLLRGNYVHEETGKARQLVGAVDSKTQRVALRFVDDESIVLECGLWNLTQDSTPLLVHFDENDTRQMTLIRLTKPEGADESGPVFPDGDDDLAP